MKTPTGTRVRKSFPTKAEAQAFISNHAQRSRRHRGRSWENGRVRTVAELLAHIVLGGKATSNIVQPARALIATAGSKNPSAVTAVDVATVCAGWDHLRPSTRQGYHTGLKRNLELA